MHEGSVIAAPGWLFLIDARASGGCGPMNWIVVLIRRLSTVGIGYNLGYELGKGTSLNAICCYVTPQSITTTSGRCTWREQVTLLSEMPHRHDETQIRLSGKPEQPLNHHQALAYLMYTGLWGRVPNSLNEGQNSQPRLLFRFGHDGRYFPEVLMDVLWMIPLSQHANQGTDE